MKIELAFLSGVFMMITSCSIQKSNSNLESNIPAGCTASPAGEFTFACKDPDSVYGEHATDYELHLKEGVLTVKNVTRDALSGDFKSDSAKFAPYVSNSTAARPACRYKSTQDSVNSNGMGYTYKLLPELFAGKASKVTMYDDAGERGSLTNLNCKIK